MPSQEVIEEQVFGSAAPGLPTLSEAGCCKARSRLMQAHL